MLPPMQPPFPPDTILQHRYRLVQVLGQGGFGRTYLAADQNRFDEHCVLKELVISQRDPELIAKAKELFYKEARILYGIRHPQVPEFRERFEVGQRLFLAQQYVPGPTCADRLHARRQQGLAFSEAEVRHLLTQVLPVLAYLHQQHILHRDISPDNIILRETDQLPVLIDFGAVKESVTNLRASSNTVIGKPLYAPPEQMQAGVASPSSDLYALAVTAVVLLSGREPGELYDAYQAAWDWTAVGPMSDDLRVVLHRMLSHRPGDRFPTAEHVQQALQVPVGIGVTTPDPPPIPAFSQMRTQAIGRPPAAPALTSQPGTQALTPPPPPRWQQWGGGSLRWLGQSLWWVTAVTGIGLWRVGKWSLGLIPKWVVGLVLLGTVVWGYERVTGKRLLPALPSIQIPQPKIEFKFPEIKLPDFNPGSLFGSPADEAKLPANEQDARKMVLDWRDRLQLNDTFFNQLVNAQFFTQHPDLPTDIQLVQDNPAHRDLRRDWFTLAKTNLERLQNTLSRESRQKLGAFSRDELADWYAQLRADNLSHMALNELTDARFFRAFPEQRAERDLLDQPAGQVWQGIASDYVNALQAGQAMTKIPAQATGWGDRFRGELASATGRAFVVYLQRGQILRLDLEATDPTILSSYSPTGRKLLDQSSRDRWVTRAQEEGYYEILLISDAHRPLNYTLDLNIQ